MARKLALVLAACLGLLHPTVFALGLGEISVDSALNQPFSATIELRNTENLERNEILANLASPTDFERIGVERFFFLSDLSFETDLGDPARPVVRVSSSQPITEPFVNFVVEVLWPSGRLLKEFTVLLDPPTYAARPLETPRAPAVPPSPTEGRIRTPAPAPTPAPSGTAAAESRATGSFQGDRYGVTDRDDTLWEIAIGVRPERDVSVHQTMLALLRLNPEAFIGGNINQLKAGYVLRVPSLEEIQRLSYQDAIVQVAEQNERWRAGLDRAPLDARGSVAEARIASSSGGELRLVSASDPSEAASGGTGRGDRTGSSSGAPASDAAAGARLADTRSRLDDAQTRNSELQSRLDANAAEVEELRRQLEVRDEQIARLQEAVRQQLEAQSGAPPASAPAPAASGGLFGFSWTIIGGFVLALLAIGVIALLVLRRVSAGGQETASFNDTLVDEDIDKTQLMPAVAGEDFADAAEDAVDDAAEGSGEGEDVIAEADVYMAYGNFSEAAAALRTAMEAEPERADIRLKLLEVHVEQGDVDAFNEQAFALQGLADEATIAQADRLAARLPGAATSSGEIVAGDARPSRESADGEVSLDFDLDVDADTPVDAAPDLDSLDIDLDLGDGDAEGAGGIDFDLDLDADDDMALDVAGDDASTSDDVALDVAGDDDLALDLDGDDELALDLDGDDDLAFDVEGDDDIALDLDGDDEGASVSAGDAVSPAAEDPFELSLEDDDDALPEIDFDLGEDAKADGGADGDGDADAGESAADDAERASASPSDDDLDFDIDDLVDPASSDDATDEAVVGMTSESAPDFADRTVIMGGDELEAAMHTPESTDDDGDDFAFDIDDLASPEAEAESGAEPTFDAVETGEETGADATDDLTELAGLAEGEGDDLDFELDDDFDFGDEDEADEITTKLELARAYVDMGDEEGAREILDEVARDGDDGQRKVAGELLEQLG